MNVVGGDRAAAYLADRAVRLDGAARYVVGIVGPPGSGKSTRAADLAEQVNAQLTAPEPTAVVLPMDGFHLSAAELDRRELTERKGSPPTFDAPAFAALLERVKAGETVRAPLYDRGLHDVGPDALTISAAATVVIVEGNYLLLDEPVWRRARAAMDETWYLDVPLDTCMDRVRRRHLAGGRPAAEAARKIATNDRFNADLVAATRHRADRVLPEGHWPG